MTAAIIEAKRIDGKPAHRLAGSPEGAWHFANSEIDAMIDHVIREIGVCRAYVYDVTGIPFESASRCRHNKMQTQEHWILRLSDFSGIPISELRQVACMTPVVQAHHRARRAA